MSSSSSFHNRSISLVATGALICCYSREKARLSNIQTTIDAAQIYDQKIEVGYIYIAFELLITALQQTFQIPQTKRSISGLVFLSCTV